MRRTLAALAAMAALLAPAAVAVALDLPGGQGSGSDARCSSGENAAGATVNAGGDGRSGKATACAPFTGPVLPAGGAAPAAPAPPPPPPPARVHGDVMLF